VHIEKQSFSAWETIFKPQECGFAQPSMQINMAVSFIVLRQENVLYQQLYIVKHWTEQKTVLGRTLGGIAVHHLHLIWTT